VKAQKDDGFQEGKPKMGEFERALAPSQRIPLPPLLSKERGIKGVRLIEIKGI
jgi:hypothetical protein